MTKDYYAEITKAANTGNTKRLRAMVQPDCSCLAVAKNIEEVWHKGSSKAPNYYQIREVSFPTVESPTTAFSNAVYTLGISVYYDKAGRVTQTFPADGKTHTSTLRFLKVRGVWKVAEVERNS